MATLKDIAEAAGVTPSTVSRALNHEKGVNEATRQKIMAIAEQMNYSASPPAPRAPGRTMAGIGVVWHRPHGLFFNRFCNELQRLAERNGRHLIVLFSDPDDAFGQLNALGAERIVFWCDSGWTPGLPFLQAKEAFQGEMLLIGGGRLPETHRLTVNRQEAVSAAVAHLAQLGHRRIVFVGGTSAKLTGYTLGLLEHQLEYNPEFIFHPRHGVEELEAAVVRLLAKAPADRPTAFIVDSHGVLFDFIYVVRRLGLSIPKDISLVAYEHVPEMDKLLGATITSVGPRVENLAERTMEMLLEASMSDDSKLWRDETVPFELVVGASSASPVLE